MKYISVNPYTEEPFAEYPIISDIDIPAIIVNSHAAFEEWQHSTWTDRLALLSNVKARLLKNKTHYAALMTSEMGKLKREAIAEIEKCAWLCDVLIQEAENSFEPITILTNFPDSYVAYEPLGVILGIMPWNYPFWQAMRCALPAITAGNTVLLKHAPNVPQCALALEELFAESGHLPVYINVFFSNEQCTVALANPLVKGVSLTGSTRAGAAVAAAAGQNIKKSVLELGGSDAFIILPDADIDKAVATAINARMMNTGQSCIAAKRFIVVEDVYDTFIEKLQAGIKALRMGNPNADDTNIAPMARPDLVQNIHRQVTESIAQGAHLVCGGQLPDTKGFFYPPTLLIDGTPGMTCCTEELFGPVAVVMKAADTDDAIRLTNSTVYGLGTSLWTRDITTARTLIPHIQSGSVFINAMVKSDPRLPFGGIKQSGYGRELSRYGMHEFVNIKTVCITQ